MKDTAELKPSITVKIDGKDHEIFASFGLIAELAGLVGSTERVIEFDLNPDIALAAIDIALVPRDDRGRPVDREFAAPAISPEVAEEIITFVADHVLAFFIRGLRRGGRRLTKNHSALKDVASSLGSIPASPSETAS